MRRHAKASTAGSTQRQATGLGRFFRGASAIRAFSRGGEGSGAPSRGRFAPTGSAVGALAALLGAVVLLVGGAAPAAAAECPNEVRRQEQGLFALRLPDCRAYENVSPGSLPRTDHDAAGAIQTSIDGNTVGYESIYPALGEEHSGHFYLSKRGPEGWTRTNIVPQESPETQNKILGCTPSVFFSKDLSKNILEQDLEPFPFGGPENEGYYEGYCNISDQVLDPREPRGYRSIFLHDLSSDAYELVSLNEADGPPGNSKFAAGSSDLSTIAVESEAQLTPEATGFTPGKEGGFNTFVWSESEGVVRLATVLPDGTPVQGNLVERLGAFSKEFSNALSDDGSKLFFEFGGALYVRYNPARSQSAIVGGACTEPAKACTVQIDKSQGPGASGGGFYEFASADGKKVFFTSDEKMTSDSTAVAGKEDLYEYNTESGALKDLTVNASEPADVWGVSDISADGSYVYFVTEAALDGTGATTPGSCANYNAGATCNLYVRHNGINHYIAALSVDDTPVFLGDRFLPSSYNGEPVEHHENNGLLLGSASSLGGLFFAFESTKSIHGEGEGFYVYDFAADQLHCLTCGLDTEFSREADRGIDPTTFYYTSESPTWRRNQVLDNGSVFFDTAAALLPADVNGDTDVYRYKDGKVDLISTGVDPGNSNFVEATPNGSDIYFQTSADLVNNDTDGAVNLYDARVSGGFAEPPALPGCEGEACRGAGTSASDAGATGSAAFKGAGNQAQPHKRDCGIAAKRAQKLSRAAKRLRRLASRSNDSQQTKRLRQRSAKLAKQGKGLSKSAKRCRRVNRGADK